MGVLTRTKKQEKRVLIRQNDVLKVVHPGGYVEVFHESVTANEIMKRYPRHCVARADVFKFPWIVVCPGSLLVPGKVFYLVPYHTIYILLKSKRENQSVEQKRRYYRRQPNHNNNINIVNHQESYCNNRGCLYKLPFYNSWNKMRRALQQGHGRSCLSLTSTVRSNVAETKQLELPRFKSCLRKEDNDRKKLGLKVSFASPITVLGSRKCSEG